MEFRLKAEEVKREAAGRWGSILRNLAPALAPALQRAGRHVDCPHPAHFFGGHGKRDFRLFRDYEETGGAICTCGTYADGFSLLMWINGWDFKTALHEVAREVGLDVDGTRTRPKPRIDQAKIDEERKKRQQEEAELNDRLRQTLNRIWKETQPADAPEAEPLRLYLARRGLPTKGIPNTLRFHSCLAYANEDKEIVGHWPALVALVQNLEGQAITLHRIYLTQDGRKAPVEAPKKLMAYPSNRQLTGSAIRLGPPTAALGVTEGIETGWAVQCATGMSVWVTINAKLLESVQVPQSVQMLCIYADKDKSETGRNSAAILVQRMWQEGRQATGLLPTMAIPDVGKGIDWLDVYNQLGARGIPNFNRVRELLRKAAGGR